MSRGKSTDTSAFIVERNRAYRRAWTLRQRGWPLKDIATKLAEEGFGQWTTGSVREAIETAQAPLDHDEMAAFVTEIGAAVEVLSLALRRMPPAAQDLGQRALAVVADCIKDWATARASLLNDGESLRRLMPGIPGFYVRPSRDQEDEEGSEPDPDSHAAWCGRRRKRAEKTSSVKPN